MKNIKDKPSKTIFGIQGGKASFNEEAITKYIAENGIENFEIKYLYTTSKVLAAVENGTVDYGIFAIQNSVGGLVDESIYAMGEARFSIIEEIEIQISHCLMKPTDMDFNDITAVMAHPQVFKQCQSSMAKKYPALKQIVGKGDLIDTATAAEAIMTNKIDHNMAILGSKNIGIHYEMDIIESNLQDDSKNFTSFLLVKKLD